MFRSVKEVLYVWFEISSQLVGLLRDHPKLRKHNGSRMPKVWKKRAQIKDENRI